MINLNYNNKSIAGNIGLGYAIAWYTSQGNIVSLPLTDTQDYDLIYDNGKLNKVQVKTTRHKQNGTYRASIKTSGGNQSWNKVIKKFDNDKVDELFVLVETGDMYAIPSKDIDAKSEISLGDKYETYKIKL
jgi:hypothetical protein